MSDQIIITAISENTSMRHSLISQHGQSLHINYFGNQYLFDVAEVYEGLSYNMNQLGIDLASLKGIILSHNHLDHTGSLPKLIPQLSTQILYQPPDMKTIKERGYKETYRFVNGKQYSLEEAIQSISKYPNAVIIEKEQEIEKGLFTTGPLLAEVQEQSLVMNIPEKGLIILVGCSHPTLPAIIDKAKLITGIDKIYGLVGGFHYKDNNDQQNEAVVRFLQSVNPEFIVPSHCTGYKAIAQLQKVMGEKVKVSPTGQFGTGNSVQLLPVLTFNLK